MSVFAHVTLVFYIPGPVWRDGDKAKSTALADSPTQSAVCLCVCVCTSACLCVCQSVCQSVRLSVCPSVCLSVCLFVCLSLLSLTHLPPGGSEVLHCILGRHVDVGASDADEVGRDAVVRPLVQVSVHRRSLRLVHRRVPAKQGKYVFQNRDVAWIRHPQSNHAPLMALRLLRKDASLRSSAGGH